MKKKSFLVLIFLCSFLRVNALILSNSVNHQADYTYNEDVIVPNGLTFAANSGAIIRFAPGAKLIIEDGASLVTNDAKLTALDITMPWWGVEVHNTDITTSNTTMAVSAELTEFTYSLQGVAALNWASGTHIIRNMLFTNCLFENNQNANFTAGASVTGGISAPPHNNSIKFDRVEFQSLVNPSSTLPNILFRMVNNILFESCHFYSDNYESIHLAFAKDITVRNSRFTNNSESSIVFHGTSTSIEIVGNNFTVPSNFSGVEHTVIENREYSVNYWPSLENLRINGNRFATLSSNPLIEYTGMDLRSSNLVAISINDNEFNNYDYPIIAYNVFGNHHSSISNNSFNNSEICISLYEDNTDLSIGCNDFKEYNTAIGIITGDLKPHGDSHYMNTFVSNISNYTDIDAHSGTSLDYGVSPLLPNPSVVTSNVNLIQVSSAVNCSGGSASKIGESIEDYNLFNDNNSLIIENLKDTRYLSIFNTLGKEVRSYQVSGSNVEIDISNLESGMYIVRFNHGLTNISHKIMK